MSPRAALLTLATLLLSVELSSCARKRHPIAVQPALAAIRSSETGLASWYGHPYHGRAAADGEIYDMEKLTAAHRTLPFGTWVRVTNLQSDKSVDARIIDRGPFVDGRIIDLSHAAARAIDLIGPGVAQVRLDILSVPRPALSENWFAVQAGAFRERERAEQLRVSLERAYGTARLVRRAGDPPMWRVLVGRERSEDAASLLAQRLSRELGHAFVVRFDETPPAASRQASRAPQ